MAEVPHFLDFKYILNESDAGKKLNPFLKKARGGIKSLKDKESKIQEEEKKLIQQKKVISAEDYKKVSELRSKVISLQKREINYLRQFQNKELKQEMNY